MSYLPQKAVHCPRPCYPLLTGMLLIDSIGLVQISEEVESACLGGGGGVL